MGNAGFISPILGNPKSPVVSGFGIGTVVWSLGSKG